VESRCLFGRRSRTRRCRSARLELTRFQRIGRARCDEKQHGRQNRTLYLSGLGISKEATREEKSAAMKQMQQRLDANPYGILIYHPPGRQFAFGKSLAVEFSTEVLQAILVIWLLAQTPISGLGGRIGFVLTAGILAAITTNISYWNWYGFPGVYTASYMLIEIVGFLLVGIVAGLMLRKGSPAM
jgi:hypothetical protein